MEVISSSSESFPPKLLVLLDYVILLLHPMEEGEGEDGDGGDGERVRSVFVMTLSHHFNFRDKAQLSGRTGRALASTWSVCMSGL